VLDNLERLSHDPRTSAFIYAFVVLLGLLWGSFANVCIYRWPPDEPDYPNGRSVVRPGSHCFACKTPIRWYDNVPLLSWLWLRGKCRTCQAPFSARYLIVEALTGLLFGLAWYLTVDLLRDFEPFDARLVRWTIYAGFAFVMVVVTFIDIDHKLILNKLMIPSIVIFYVLGAFVMQRGWIEGLVGIAIGYGVPWLIGELYFRLKGREGLGLGDAMLLALVGALLGWKGVLFSLCGGSIVGTVLISMALLRKQAQQLPAGRRIAGSLGGLVLTIFYVAMSATEMLLRIPAGIAGFALGLVRFPVTLVQALRAPPEDEVQEEIFEEEEEPSLLRTELPFGPFLCLAALFYLFAEPWIELHFALFNAG
jgi:leader peptidase (prepilin peptidase)/N-methyltransferase